MCVRVGIYISIYICVCVRMLEIANRLFTLCMYLQKGLFRSYFFFVKGHYSDIWFRLWLTSIAKYVAFIPVDVFASYSPLEFETVLENQMIPKEELFSVFFAKKK